MSDRGLLISEQIMTGVQAVAPQFAAVGQFKQDVHLPYAGPEGSRYRVVFEDGSPDGFFAAEEAEHTIADLNAAFQEHGLPYKAEASRRGEFVAQEDGRYISKSRHEVFEAQRRFVKDMSASRILASLGLVKQAERVEPETVERAQIEISVAPNPVQA